MEGAGQLSYGGASLGDALRQHCTGGLLRLTQPHAKAVMPAA